ncbi:MAG: hypothetical protein HKO92_12175 [Flavobacteriaceae bacterium]|nr:hypothetical protein [Flavobacteriaceae bacterium]
MLVTDYAINDTITFGQTTVGVTTVTLSTLDWSGISGLRKGFRFLLDNENGEAIILDDPQFESNTLNVNIIKPLTSTFYSSGNWVLRVPRTKEVKDYLPRNAKTTLILPEYLDSLQDISIDELHDAITRLRNIRRWNVMDPEFLDVFIQSLGLVFKTESFDIETRRRFVKELPSFLELSGTKFYINYISFVIGALFTIDELWSNNYIDFILREDIVGSEDGWYPTNHVELSFDATIFGVLDVPLIVDLFYIFSSVPLVLQRINQLLNLPTIEVQSPSLITSTNYETFIDITP